MRRAALVVLLSGLASTAQAQDCPSARWLGPDRIAGPGLCLPETTPTRIAVLDPFYSLQMALSLDLPVVAAPLQSATAGRVAPPQGIADLGTFTDPDPEALVSAAPDLILGDAYMHRDFLELLSSVAPTVLVAQSGWKDYLRAVAQAGGATEKAEQQLADYEAEVADLRARIPAGTTVSFLRAMPGGFQVYVDGPAAYGPVQVMRDAGLVRPTFETVTDGTVLKRPGLEGLSALTGETLIYVIGGAEDQGDPASLRAELLAQSAWQALPAVKAGRAFEVEPGPWLGFGGLHSAQAVLADLRRIFAPG